MNSFENELNGDSATALLEAPETPVVAPAPAPKPRSSRYQSLDMWRGIACMMLVMYHGTFYATHSWQSRDSSTWTLGGLAVNLLGRMWIGVPIFFVVSGYCIAASSDASRRRPHSLRVYFTRRFRRIYPPLWIACALCIGIVLVVGLSEYLHNGCVQLPKLSKFTAGNWLGNLTATEAWRGPLAGGEAGYLMKNTWTLCYEEQFYAVVGVILLLAANRFFAAAAVVTFLTLIGRHVARAFGAGTLQGVFFDGHWLLFAIGILVYYRLNYGWKGARWSFPLMLLCVLAYAVVDYRLSTTPFDKHVNEYLVVASFFGLFLTALRRADDYLINHRFLKFFTWYGKMSYSVYLTHFPVVVLLAFVMSEIGTNADWFVALVTVPLGVLISIPIGRAFHLMVERHFMNAPLSASRPASAQ